MRMKPRCVPCILNRVIYESELVIKDERKIEYVMKNVVKKIGELYGKNLSSAEIATQIHGLTYKLIENNDPYKKLKEKSNEIAIKFIPKIEEFIKKSKNRLEAAMLASVAANSIDFGIAGSISPHEIETKFEEYMEEGFGWNDFEKLEKYLKGNILYFTDNCGEIVFDKIVCRELKKYDIHITLVTKKYPILTDATYEDAKKFGFEEVVDEVITTGGFAVGIDFNSMSEKLKDRIEKASLIISKGMANYEALSETNYRPIAYLLRVKCKSIAESMELPVNINAIKLYE